MRWLRLIKLVLVFSIVAIGSNKIIDRPTSVLEKEQNLSLEILKNNSANTKYLNTLATDSNINKQKQFTVYRSRLSIVIAVVISGTVFAVYFLRPLIVRIDRDEVGIKYKKFGSHLPSNRQIAVEGEMGIQADTLAPGRHFLFPGWMYIVSKEKAREIGKDEIGLVEAKDGKPLPSGKMFGDAVECDDFQDGRAFINQGGQRGQQLAILRNGIYRINTELFEVKISLITHIGKDEIGLVEAKDGKPLPSGQMFGKIVECDNFQNGREFIEQGGQRGQQLERRFSRSH